LDLADERAVGSPAATPSDPPRLKIGLKFFYAFGQTVESGYLTVAPFIFFYYTAVLGLSGSMVGLALAISTVIDAILDPLIGSWSDNIRSRFGRRLPMMLMGAPLMALTLGLLFAPPLALAPFVLFLWLTVMKMALRGFASVFNLPYFALGAEMADGYVERSSVVAWRTVAGILVGVLITILAYSIFFSRAGGLQGQANYPPFGWTMAAMCLVGGAICCLGIWRFAASLPQPMTARQSVLRSLGPELLEIFRNTSFRTLFFSALVIYVGVGMNATLNSHAYVFAWRIQPATIQTITFAYLFGLLIGVPITPLLLRRLEKRSAVLLGLAMVIATWIALPSLRAAGVLTPTGTDALPWLAGNIFIAGVGTGFLAIAYPSMMADAADEHEVKFGARREGLYFAGLGFAAKSAAGIGQLLAGVALDVLRFPKEAGRQVGAVLPEDLIRHLMILWGPLPAILAIVSAVMLLPYVITRTRHEDIAAALKIKRAEDVSAGRSS
jgi:GPH family glycoside/pentoside/hexuronide:cation symporter